MAIASKASALNALLSFHTHHAVFQAMHAITFGARTSLNAKTGNAVVHALHVPRAYLARKILIASAVYASAGCVRYPHARTG